MQFPWRYAENMRRILQFSSAVLILTVFLAPISEAFDRWDPAGLGHDTEFAVFAFVFSMALVLLVSKLMAMLAQIILLLPFPGGLSRDEAPFHAIDFMLLACPPPDTSPPLRI